MIPFIFILILTSFLSFQSFAQSHLNAKPHEFVIKLKDPSSFQQYQLPPTNGFKIIKHFGKNNRFLLVKNENIHLSPQKVIHKLTQLSFVQYAEPNWIYRINETKPDDPRYSRLWGIKKTQIDEVWDIHTGGAFPIVAVIDTGVDYEHEDLQGNLWMNANEIPDNQIDDDQNGFIDDIYGYNFLSDHEFPLDDNGHGTHCAGTIGAKGNNQIGITGVNWDTQIMSLKFLNEYGSGSTDDAVPAIEYATDMGAKVISASWSSPNFSQALYEVIEEAKQAGVLFVAAAGNEKMNNDALGRYPANYALDNVISVGASTHCDLKASFSNYGAYSVDLFAPGQNIFSLDLNNQYKSRSGTSMATPHVAGAAALLWSQNLDWDYSEIKERLLASSDFIKVLQKKAYTSGRLNLNNAFLEIYPPRKLPIEEQNWQKEPYTLESSHPYENDLNQTFTITHPEASYLRVHFNQLTIENGYDKLQIEDKNGKMIDELTGGFGSFTSFGVKGDTLTIRLVSDNRDGEYGFSIDYYEWY